jgi:hypothetical protein
MGRAARVISIDVVEAMSAAVESFRREAASALEDLDMEIRRALEWIHHDRREYWAGEVRRGWERVSEARVQLQQAQTFRRIGDRNPSCIDEKKALEQTKRRLEVAQEKVEAVRHWTNAIDRAVNEYRTGRGQLTSWLDADFPRAEAVLKRVAATLETYVALETPGDLHAAMVAAFEPPEPLAASPTEPEAAP